MKKVLVQNRNSNKLLSNLMSDGCVLKWEYDQKITRSTLVPLKEGCWLLLWFELEWSDSSLRFSAFCRGRLSPVWRIMHFVNLYAAVYAWSTMCDPCLLMRWCSGCKYSAGRKWCENEKNCKNFFCLMLEIQLHIFRGKGGPSTSWLPQTFEHNVSFQVNDFCRCVIIWRNKRNNRVSKADCKQAFSGCSGEMLSVRGLWALSFEA